MDPNVAKLLVAVAALAKENKELIIALNEQNKNIGSVANEKQNETKPIRPNTLS